MRIERRRTATVVLELVAYYINPALYVLFVLVYLLLFGVILN